MSRLRELLDAEEANTADLCKFGLALSQLEVEERVELEDAVDARVGEIPRFSNRALARVTEELGYPIGPDTIAKHRAKRCGCFR